MSRGTSCIVLSGTAGSGKTSSLRALAAAAAEAGHCLAIALQLGEGRLADGRARGFSMELLRTVDGSLVSERRILARGRSAEESPAAGTILHGQYVFDRGVFSWTEDFLRRELASPRKPTLIGLDEIGKLELGRGEGLAACLDASLEAMSGEGGPRLLVLTARGINVPAIRDFLEKRGIDSLVLEVANRDEILRRSLAALAAGS